jgi:protein-S-isoprenylcysteine O-methyltransferase
MNSSNMKSPKSSNFLQLTLHSFSSVYLLLAGVCLVRWGEPNPWTRLDMYSVTYLLLRALSSVHSLGVSRRALRNRQVRQEWWGASSDPQGITWVVGLMLADLAVFLDYSHWRLVTSLEEALLQGVGLGLYVGVTLWQMWTDEYLARHFHSISPERSPMSRGPYRYIRHPRYSAAIVGKVAFALVFASVLGWLLLLAWATLLVRKVEVEEAHLKRLFGSPYEAYQRRTARLLPGIY